MDVKLFSEDDSIEELTGLIRNAYRQLADLGFRYWATHQSAEDTRERISKGECFVVKTDAHRLIATITLNYPKNTTGCSWYDTSDVASFGQFAVAPGHQKNGIGSLLLQKVENRAKELGVKELSCDTAIGATHLIEMYRKKGFRKVGTADWEMTNYISVILSKSLNESLVAGY